jgi:hypothetical protein
MIGTFGTCERLENEFGIGGKSEQSSRIITPAATEIEQQIL